MPREHAAHSIRYFFDALQRRDIEEAARYTGEGFSVQTPGGYPLNARDFWKAQIALWAAFPDLSYEPGEIRQSLSLGSASIRITGTFLHDLALPFAGLPVYEATGECFALPREQLGFTLEWGEILTIRNESPTGMGLLGPMFGVGAVLPPPGIMG